MSGLCNKLDYQMFVLVLVFIQSLSQIVSGARAVHIIIQNNNLFQELIKAQNKRDLDPPLMSIPMFTGEDSSQCLDWIKRIKNVCVQSGHSL